MTAGSLLGTAITMLTGTFLTIIICVVVSVTAVVAVSKVWNRYNGSNGSLVGDAPKRVDRYIMLSYSASFAIGYTLPALLRVLDVVSGIVLSFLYSVIWYYCLIAVIVTCALTVNKVVSSSKLLPIKPFTRASTILIPFGLIVPIPFLLSATPKIVSCSALIAPNSNCWNVNCVYVRRSLNNVKSIRAHI